MTCDCGRFAFCSNCLGVEDCDGCVIVGVASFFSAALLFDAATGKAGLGDGGDGDKDDRVLGNSDDCDDNDIFDANDTAVQPTMPLPTTGEGIRANRCDVAGAKLLMD